jgi:hypothetical protein
LVGGRVSCCRAVWTGYRVIAGDELIQWIASVRRSLWTDPWHHTSDPNAVCERTFRCWLEVLSLCGSSLEPASHTPCSLLFSLQHTSTLPHMHTNTKTHTHTPSRYNSKPAGIKPKIKLYETQWS